MPLPVTDIETLHTYIDGVMGRADHHAKQVGGIALALAGAVVWRKDKGSKIKVMQKSGEMKNVLWVKINSKDYAFSYNHENGAIEMRQGSMQGDVLQSFSNATPIEDVEQTFRAL